MSLPQPHRPFTIKLLNSGGRILSWFGVKLPVLQEEAMLERARRQTGLSDFGGDEFQQGLHQLLSVTGCH